MKNREKYSNTDDALKAFKEHNKVCDCGCSFEEWLDKENPSLLNTAIAGILVSSLFREIIGAKDKPADKESEKRSNDDDLTDVECPFCHLKNGIIRRGNLFPDFYCPNCDLLITKKSLLKMSSNVDVGTFKSWFDKLTVPAPKKD